MIPAREVRDLRAEWSLDVGVIEKDYVLGWLLAGIANEPELAGTWVFKGGTCLRKCYYETFRFSEDLDFTVINGGPETPEALMAIFGRISGWLREEVGIDLVVEDASFRVRKNKRDHLTAQGRLSYRGPNRPPQLPKVKLDLTADEVLVINLRFGSSGIDTAMHPFLATARSVIRSSSSSARSSVPWLSAADHAISTTSCTCIGIPILSAEHRR